MGKRKTLKVIKDLNVNFHLHLVRVGGVYTIKFTNLQSGRGYSTENDFLIKVSAET